MLSLVESSVVAAAIICVLTCMGARNRRQGWRREQHDLVADVRELWAEFGSGAPTAETLSSPAPSVSPANAQLATLQMLRLDSALREFGRGKTVEVNEKEEFRTSGGAADLAAQYQRRVQL